MSLRRALRGAAAATLLAALPAPIDANQQAALRILRPGPDQVVSGSTVVVEIEVDGVVLGGRSRNGAYALLTLDRMPPVKSLAATFRFRNVDAGSHELLVELRRPDGSRFEPAVEERVRFRSSARADRRP